MKRWDRLWAVSLMVLGCAAVVLGVSQLLDAQLPDAVVRLLGVIDLVAIAVFAFASARLWSEKKRS